MTTDEIKIQINDIFSPLAQKLGLLGYTENDRSNTTFSIAYISAAIGIELNVDLSDFFIYALLFKPEGKTIPVGYESESGGRQKIYIQEALKVLSVDARSETQALQSLAGNYHNCAEILEILKNLIEKNWNTLISEHDRLFG
jgi:hypothetical protein